MSKNFKIRFQIKENLIGNQGISMDRLIVIFFISIRKIARSYGVHILLRFCSFLACACGARILTSPCYDLKPKIPVSFRQVSILVKIKQKTEKIRDFETDFYCHPHIFGLLDFLSGYWILQPGSPAGYWPKKLISTPESQSL